MNKLENYLYFETQLGKLYHGNNADILPLLTNNIKLCLTSPPYNIGQREYRRSDFFYGGQSTNTNEIYDRIKDNLSGQEYRLQQHTVLKHIWGLLVSDGVIFYNHKPRILYGIFDDRKNLIPDSIPLRQEIIWYKGGQINFNGSFFVPNTERIFILAHKGWKPNKEYLKLGEVWDMPSCGVSKTKINHPSVFPLRLAENIIVSSTNENEIVLDPYIGSGTTALACEKLNRKWIGIEISEKYCKIAQHRIEMESEQIKMDFKRNNLTLNFEGLK